MLSRERVAVCAYFGILGFVCATWMSSIDDVKVLLGLTQDELGWLLFSGPVGNLVSFTFASSFCARFGSRTAVRLSASVYLVAASALALCFACQAPIFAWCGSIALLGASGNLVNIAINTQAGLVEKRAGRPIMSSFHGIFSVTCLASGFLALLLTARAVPVAVRFALVLAVVVLLHLVFAWRLPADDASASPQAHRWHRPDRSLVALGLAAVVIMGCEGAVCDWVGVYFRESLQVPPSRVKWGFCAVTGLMALGRFVTDGLVARYTARRILHLDSLLVSSGLLVALSVPFLPVAGLPALLLATAGYAVTGFGISGLIPILYSKVNRTTVMPPASALTFIGTMGFFGYFMGPPLIGHLARLFNLSAALGLFALLILTCLLVDPDA